MFKKIWNWLFEKCPTVEPSRYNFHEDFREFIPIGESVVFILDMARYIEHELNISYTQVEILLFIMNYSSCPELTDIQDYMSHISDAHTRRLVKKLEKASYINSTKLDNKLTYNLDEETEAVINNYAYL